jgi:ATP-dependent exoDNAse (exonuclease V) beta subunit
MIVKDVAAPVVEAGLAEYQAWRARRDEAIAQGSRPSLTVRTVREHVRAAVTSHPAPGTPHSAPGTRHPAPDGDDVPVIEVSRVPDRPIGPRFGTLVHALLAIVPLDAGADRIREVAVLQGRVLGAEDEEVAAAAEVAGRVLAHGLLARARAAAARHVCRRESPVMMKDEAGTLIEGVVDLAFEEGGAWTVVDFKTDQELESELDLYRRQVSLYATMIGAATGKPARAILMRI